MRGRILCLAAVLILTAAALCGCQAEHDISAFTEKAALLRQSALADWVRLELGVNPAGDAGNAVFFSVCDGTKRADIYTGTGATVDEAWDSAVDKAGQALKESGMEPRWVKADVVYLSQGVTEAELEAIGWKNAWRTFGEIWG